MDSEQKKPVENGLENELKVGEILDDRYELTEIVGRGGCGLVFRAMDLNLQRDVAVKVLSGEGLKEKSAQRKFENESKILRRLHAQNTVFFYDCGQTAKKQPYFVMEFVSGRQLKDLLEEEGKLEAKRVVSILIQVFSALDEAHQYGYVHRDLKPGNIMLCRRPGFPDDFVKVLDFGIAKIMSQDESPEHHKSEMAGTPKYMPPEQFKNEEMTPLADLYSMGCIAYEMLTGIAPFDGDTLHVIVAKHLFMTPRSFPPEIEVYPNLVATIFKLLEKQPENRFESAQSVIEALEHWNEPELIPALAGCRIKGDDDQDSSFYEDDSLEIPAVTKNPHDVLNMTPMVTEPVIVPKKRSVSKIGIQSRVNTQLVEPPPKLNKKTALLLSGLGIFALIVIIGFFVFISSDDSTPENTAQDSAIEENSTSIDPLIIDSVVTSLSSSTIDAAAFGCQEQNTLLHLEDFYELNDDVNDEQEKKEPEPKRRPKKVDKTPETPYAIFEFKLIYEPVDAHVNFLNAAGNCLRRGTCIVKTKSDTKPARVVISARGYETRSVVVEKNTQELTIRLVPAAKID